MENSVLTTIKERRSIYNFKEESIDDDKLEAILEAGRWAPSWQNKQPWNFVVIKDQELKEEISEYVPTIFNRGVKDAPVCIAVFVDPEIEPNHYIEDGSAATQNMLLAAQSLGFGSVWIGVLDLKKNKGTAEEKIREALDLPKKWRLISVLPIGVPKKVPETGRKDLSEIVNWDHA